jgi:hypothetical protein
VRVGSEMSCTGRSRVRSEAELTRRLEACQGWSRGDPAASDDGTKICPELFFSFLSFLSLVGQICCLIDITCGEYTPAFAFIRRAGA